MSAAVSASDGDARFSTAVIYDAEMADRRLVDNFWDLRDDAYDHPDRWQGVTAEALFQCLAEFVEEAEEGDEPIDWWRDVAERVIAWRAAELND